MILNSENFILIASLLLFVSVFAGKAGSRFGIPALLLFLGVGMAFGGEGLGIEFNSPGAAQFIGVIALSIILFSGGMDTNFSDVKPILGKGITLATLGVVITTVIMGFFIYYLSGLMADFVSLTLAESMLLAAVMSSTDSASVFSILSSKKQGLKQRIRPLLEFESGSNDAMAYMLTILLIQSIQSTQTSVWGFVLMFFLQMIVGAVAGFLLGKLALLVMNKINIDNKSLYSVLLLAFALFVFSFTDLIKGNGYLAVYIAGLVVGNGKLIYKKHLKTFFDGFAWLFQIVMFITLGLLVNPSEVWKVTAIGLLIGVFMIIIARPVAVFTCLAPFKSITTKGKFFISWVGLRGAVPIIFATYPLLVGIENSQFIFNVVFFITIMSLLVQGTTVGKMADWLGLSTEYKQGSFNIDLPENAKASLSEIEVRQSLIMNGDMLMDLTLPEDTLVVMVHRKDKYFVPKGTSRLLVGDVLLVVSENDEQKIKELADMGIEPPTV